MLRYCYLHEKLLLRLGADKVVFPERDAGIRIANIYGRESVFECIALEDGYSVYEIAVPEEWVGKSVKEINVRAHYGVNILGIKKGSSGKLNPDVGPNLQFVAGDVVMLVGDSDRLAQFLNK